MKVGFNMLLWATHIGEDRFDLFETLKKTGYDGVEIPIFEGDPSHFEKLGRAVRDAGLEANGITVMPDAARDAISSDAAARKGALDHIAWATDCTAAMGGTMLAGPLHQALGRFSGEGRTPQEWDHGVETLRRAADRAAHRTAEHEAIERAGHRAIAAAGQQRRGQCIGLAQQGLEPP